MSKRWFKWTASFLVAALVGVVGLSITAKPASAQIATEPSQLIGAHVGEGDINAQIDIINMIAEKGAPAGFPITVMVGTQATDSQVSSLAQAIASHGFYAIIRVGIGTPQVCEGIDPRPTIELIKTHFGPDTPIEYGNEVNNQDLECKSYESYAEEYSLINGTPKLGPSAIDFYNTAYPAENFLNNSAISSVGMYHGSAEYYFANAYGCVGETGACDPVATSTQTKGYSYISSLGTYFLTEFSLSGENNIANGPASNLDDVITFIETHAPATGAKAITPLVWNVCNSDGVWLIYLNIGGDVKIYTKSGDLVDPATCTAFEEDGDADHKDYYLYQIRSLNDTITSVPDDFKQHGAMVAEELINQGYEVMCTAPKLFYEGDLVGWEDYANWVWGGDKQAALDALPNKLNKSEQYLDYRNANYPIFRRDPYVSTKPAKGLQDIEDAANIDAFFGGVTSEEPATEEGEEDPLADHLFESIETYWGFRNTDEDLPQLTQDINSAPLYRLLTLDQQCMQQKAILQAVADMCSELDDIQACALYDKIPETEYTTKTLYVLTKNLDCTAEARANPANDDLFDALNKTPLYLQKAYRLAFLVATIDLLPPPEQDGWWWGFLGERDTDEEVESLSMEEKRQETRVIAFKIPDVGTNKEFTEDELEGGTGKYYYKEPLQITRDVLLTERQKKDNLKKFEEQKDEFEEVMLKMAAIDFPTPDKIAIDCVGYYCEDPLTRGLVNMINGWTKTGFGQDRCTEQRKSASDIKQLDFEPVQTIRDQVTFFTDPQSIVDSPWTLFKTGFQLISDIFSGEIRDNNPHEMLFKMESPMDPSLYLSAGKPPLSSLNVYLVYPVGYELEQVEKTIVGLIMTPDQIEAFYEDEETEPYFQLSDILQDFIMTKRGVFTYYLEPGHEECPFITEDGSEPKPCPKHVYYDNNDLNASYGKDNSFDSNYKQLGDTDLFPRVHGGILGHLMREVQKAVRQFKSPSWQAINDCPTTEDYLLGRCGATVAVDYGCLRDKMATAEEKCQGDETCLAEANKEARDSCQALDANGQPAIIDPTITDETCSYRSQMTTPPISFDQYQEDLCKAAASQDLPGWMLRSILAIEGGNEGNGLAIDLEGGANGSAMSDFECTVSDSGDVGPFQIHVDSCTDSPTGSGSSYATGDLCSYEGGAMAAASALRSKMNTVLATFSQFDGYNDWTEISDPDLLYELFYLTGGRYNGNPPCVDNPDSGPQSVGSLNGTPMSYCKYFVEYIRYSSFSCGDGEVPPTAPAGFK